MNRGIYKILSKARPENVYIGSAIDFTRRKNTHLQKLRKNKHHNVKLQNHFNKYGESDLLFHLVEVVIDAKNLIPREQAWIDNEVPYFNICRKAGSKLGVSLGPEARRKISEANSKRVLSESTKDKISKSNKGKRLGMTASPETKLKMGMARKGRKHSEEARLKISKSNTGRFYSEETRRKIGDAHRGKKLTESTKLKINRTGKKHKEETKEKIRAAALIREQLKRAA